MNIDISCWLMGKLSYTKRILEGMSFCRPTSSYLSRGRGRHHQDSTSDIVTRYLRQLSYLTRQGEDSVGTLLATALLRHVVVLLNGAIMKSSKVKQRSSETTTSPCTGKLRQK